MDEAHFVGEGEKVGSRNRAQRPKPLQKAIIWSYGHMVIWSYGHMVKLGVTTAMGF